MKSSATEFRFELLLKNPSDVPVGPGAVVLSIDTDRAEAATDLEDSGDRASLELARADMAQTESGEDQRVEVVVSREDIPLLLTRELGVYPIRAEFTETGEAANKVSAAAAGKALGTPAPKQDVGAGTDDASDATEAAAAQGEGAGDETPEEPLSLRASTSVVWNGVDSVSPLPLTLVVPLVLHSDVQALPDRDELAGAAPTLLQLLDAAEQRNATIAVDPRIIAGIRALGTAAPGSAATLLDRLERSSAPMFLLQFADADPAVQAALGFDTLMQPLGFDHATALGSFEPPSPEAASTSDAATAPEAGDAGTADTPESAGTQGAESTRSVAESDTATTTKTSATSDDEAPKVDPETGVPSLETLLTFENARPGAWPAGGEVDSATLTLLQGADLTSLVLDSSNVSNATSSRVTIGEFDALIADAPAGLAARTSISAQTATERAAGTAQLASLLALAAQADDTGIVLALDRGAIADITDPLRILDSIDDMTWVQPVSERQQTSGTAVLRAGSSTEERRELLRATMLRSQQIDELAPLLEHPEFLTEYQRERLLGALATRYAAPEVDFAKVDQWIKKRDDELLAGVKPVVSENTQLVGALSNVPITLSNALPFDTLVKLHVMPTSAAIALEERDFEVRVPAAGSANVLVPVQSRVSSGEAGLLLEVRDVADEVTFSSALHSLTLRTAVETVLIWVLGAAAASLLGFGIWRSVRRRRTSGHEDGAPRAIPSSGE